MQCRIDKTELSRKAVDAIRVAVRAYLLEEESMLQETGLHDIAGAVSRVVEEATSHLLIFRLQNPNLVARDVTAGFFHTDSQLFDEERINIPEWLHDTPLHILGISMKQLYEKVAPLQNGKPRLQILHCEKVMRADFRSNFHKSQDELRESLSRLSLNRLSQAVPQECRRNHGKGAKEEVVNYLVRLRLTFHGTRARFVKSIVRHGFLRPGDKHPKTGEELKVRCGNTYGAGIYSSPDPHFALCYSTSDASKMRKDEISGLKLIVCATLMGRAAPVFREDNWRKQR